MKHIFKTAVSMLLIFTLLFCAVSCTEKDVWENATYTSDTILGEGANTVTVELTAQEKTIIFTVKTDKSTLGEALFEHDLINDPIFFDTFNGIKADWNKDKAFWALYVGGEYATFGVGDEKAITTGNPTYKFVYTK